jgi:hypothetical protein
MRIKSFPIHRYSLRWLLAGVLLFAPTIMAQIHVEEEVTNDSVDVFAETNKPGKSAALAMVANLVLPGLGHYIFGEPKIALGYFTAEALFIFGAFSTSQYSSELNHSARSFAYAYANVQGGAGANDFFWENVGKTMDSDGLNQSRSLGYNQIMDLNRESDNNKYLVPNLQWRWIDETYRKQYNNLIKRSLHYKVASNFFLGGMLLNRIVSFVDVRTMSRHKGKGLFSTMHFYPNYNALTGASSLTCASEF